MIQQALEQEKSNANRWWYGWLIGYSAATIGQGSVILTSKSKETRQDIALGAATTFLGAVGQIITPMVPGTAPDRIAGIAERTPEERANKLFEAEKLLKDSASREKEGRSWKTHAITGVVNLGSELVDYDLSRRTRNWYPVLDDRILTISTVKPSDSEYNPQSSVDKNKSHSPIRSHQTSLNVSRDPIQRLVEF